MKFEKHDPWTFDKMVITSNQFMFDCLNNQEDTDDPDMQQTGL